MSEQTDKPRTTPITDHLGRYLGEELLASEQDKCLINPDEQADRRCNTEPDCCLSAVIRFKAIESNPWRYACRNHGLMMIAAGAIYEPLAQVDGREVGKHVCSKCGYHTNGIICTHCDQPASQSADHVASGRALVCPGCGCIHGNPLWQEPKPADAYHRKLVEVRDLIMSIPATTMGDHREALERAESLLRVVLTSEGEA